MIETIYFCLSQVPYVATLVFALPRVSVGSRSYWVSNFHRLFGVLTLTYPLFLALYQSFYLSEPHIIFYLFGILVISFNCIFGALLIRKRLNKFDIPTIRAFCVGVILGLSFVGLSLNYKFGHLKWYQPFGYFFSIYSIIAIIYSCNDSIQHLYRMITGPKQFRSINLGHFKPPKLPSDPEMKKMILDSFNNDHDNGDGIDDDHDDDDKYNKNKNKNKNKLTSVYQKATLYDAFILSTFKQLKNYNKIMFNCSLTPSNIPVVFTVTVTAIFALTNLLNVYYLKCGYVGMK